MANLITIKEPEQSDECFSVEILAEGACEPSANYYRTMRGARIAAHYQMKRSVSYYVEPEVFVATIAENKLR